MNHIRIQHGLLIGWFGSENMQLATSNFMTVDQVKSTKKITFIT